MSLLSFLSGLFTLSKADVIQPPPLNIDRLIKAIADAEDSRGKIGVHGERGRLQFTATRWYQLSPKPHRWAGWRHPFAIAETERVERLHIQDLIRDCQILRLVPTPYTVGLLHTAGFGAVQMKAVSAMKKDFAQRVENLYDSATYANTPIGTLGN